MLRIRLLRASPLILALVLAACGGEPPTTAQDNTASSAAPAAEPVASSEPVPEPASPTVAASSEVAAQGGDGVGEQTYQKTCAMCHGSPAMGAPVAGNKDDWKDRIAQGKDTLYKHALEGFTGAKGMMPARGGNPSLDDASVKAAVDHMVAKSQ
jgi:cytochrome c5